MYVTASVTLLASSTILTHFYSTTPVSDSLLDAFCDSDNDALLEAVALAVPVGKDIDMDALLRK